jgi:hypothetical protein
MSGLVCFVIFVMVIVLGVCVVAPLVLSGRISEQEAISRALIYLEDGKSDAPANIEKAAQILHDAQDGQARS